MRKNLAREYKALQKMIEFYCRSHHLLPDSPLCPDCQSLAEYAHQRIDRCPLRSSLRVGPDKPTCAKCPIHCYRQDRREEIRTFLRYSGPACSFTTPSWPSITCSMIFVKRPNDK